MNKTYSLPLITLKFSRNGRKKKQNLNAVESEYEIFMSPGCKFKRRCRLVIARNQMESKLWHSVKFHLQMQNTDKNKLSSTLLYPQCIKIEDWGYFLNVIKMNLFNRFKPKTVFCDSNYSIKHTSYIQECRVTCSKVSKIFHWPDFRFSLKVWF